MSSRILNSRTYIKSSHPYAYATFTNFEHGKGLLQIHSDWGIFHSYWGATGTRHLEEFVLDCNNSYLASSFNYWMNFMQGKKSAFVLTDKMLLHCWPELKEIIKEEFEKIKSSKQELTLR